MSKVNFSPRSVAASLALAGGVVTTEIAHWRRGEEPKRDDPSYAYALLQRSGVLGWAGSYADAGVKLFAPSLAGSASKYSQNSAIANMLGPGYGTLEFLSGMGADFARGELSDVGKKAMKLAPLNQQATALLRLFGDHD